MLDRGYCTPSFCLRKKKRGETWFWCGCGWRTERVMAMLQTSDRNWIDSPPPCAACLYLPTPKLAWKANTAIPTLPTYHGTHGLRPRHNQDSRSAQRRRKEQGRQIRLQQLFVREKVSKEYQQPSDGKEIGDDVWERWRACIDHHVGRLCGEDRRWWNPS